MLHQNLDEATIARINSLVDRLVTLTDSGLVRTRQGYTVERVYEVRDQTGKQHKLRTHIDRDSYDFQSHYRVERWDGTQWQRVTAILGEARPDMPSPYSRDDAEIIRAVDELESELLHDAAAVILP